MARRGLNGQGRLLIRKSGTEPVIRVMAEGDDEKRWCEAAWSTTIWRGRAVRWRR